MKKIKRMNKPSIHKIKPIIDYEEIQEETRYAKEYEKKEELKNLEMQDRDVYTEDGIMTRIDDETINSTEGGFMMGYLAA